MDWNSILSQTLTQAIGVSAVIYCLAAVGLNVHFGLIEPKKGVPGVGMVGSENTYRVTPDGGVSLTGTHPGLLLV